MKFTVLLPLTLAATSAFGASLTGRHDVIKARQAKVARADNTNTCGNINNKGLIVPGVLPHSPPINVGNINACLCTSGISNFEATNVVAQAGVILAGAPAVTTALTNLINAASDHQVCTYPAHATAVCSASNPCGFSCGDGYSPFTPPGHSSPSSCTCSSPKKECNGKCGTFPGGCGSQTPTKRRVSRRSDEPCPVGLDICGVTGGNGWDCVNIEKDRDSCGGCAIPSPFAPAASSAGIDCTRMPNVDTVDCVSGSCYVRSCQSGFTVSSSHDGCVTVNSVVKAPIVAAGEIAMGLVGGITL